MSITFTCPNCDKKLKAASDAVGRAVVCKQCGTKLVVPSPDEAASEIEDDGDEEVVDEPKKKHVPVATTKLMGSEDLVDMTAMVDIVFFLLIFFMVTSTNRFFPGIAMPLPNQAAAAATGSRSLQDVLDDSSSLMVRIDRDDTIWLEGAEVRGEQDLRTRLRELCEEANSTRKMFVMGHGDARHATVVMVLDAGNDVGMEEIRMAVVDEDL